MFNRGKGTTASIISTLVFVGCVAAMVANFNLWPLPLAALPFLIYCNIDYKGHWDSKKADKQLEKDQDEEPYSRTWPFSALEDPPADSKRQEIQNKIDKRERKMEEYAQIRAERRELDERYRTGHS